MASENGLFQNYFTSYRRTPPRRLAATTVGLWGRSKFSRNPIKSGSEPLPSRVKTIMEPQFNLTTTNGGLSHDQPAEPSSSSYDPEIFRSYLLSLLPPVIGALPSELDSLFDHNFDERVARFATETGGVIYVVKVKDEVEGAFKYFLQT